MTLNERFVVLQTAMNALLIHEIQVGSADHAVKWALKQGRPQDEIKVLGGDCIARRRESMPLIQAAGVAAIGYRHAFSPTMDRDPISSLIFALDHGLKNIHEAWDRVRIQHEASCSIPELADGTAPADDDDPALKALTPDEQVFFDALTDEAQTGPVIVAALDRDGYKNFDESKISRMWKRPKLHARGVRHEKKAGYYILQDKYKATAR